MFRIITSLIILGAIFFVWVNPLAKVVEPCTEPLSYRISLFDRRFGLSYEGFLAALAEAEGVWESASGIELFAYEPEMSDGGTHLKINLIYDYRQEVTNELSKIESVVENSESAYRTLERDYLALKSEHVRLEALYQSRLALFNQHNATYSQSVEGWNQSNRTNKQQFQKLEEEKRALEQEFAQLKELEAELNKVVRDVNATVEELNRMAKTLNLNVEQFNTVGSSRGETFAGGIYTSDVTGERIDIYEFSNHNKLVRVLAHELGHALGLEHINDPGAIMYYLNESAAGKLTEADIDSLKTLCRIN